MKKFSCVLLFAMLIKMSAFSQWYYTADFDTSTSLPWQLDTTQAGNIWQVGPPQKTVFDSAYSAPNAMVTDTINSYPVNNLSSFSITVTQAMVFNSWNFIVLMIDFYHKYDTDSLHDGGFIEVSTDGVMWQNIIYFPFLQFAPNAYSASDTIAGGIPAFSGSSNGWQPVQYFIMFCGMPLTIDSLMFRFTFKSDSINSNREGWMIDNLIVFPQFCEGVEENLSHFEIVLSPIPASNELRIQNSEFEIENVEIYGALGKKIFPTPFVPLSLRRKYGRDEVINISSLTPGIYFIRIKTEKGIITKKFVKQ